jgi:hypothetical protein
MIGARFGLIALIPAMLNLTVAVSGGTIGVQICKGDGQARTMQIPVGGSGDGGEQSLCCAKGCNSRKRISAKIEPAQ